MQENKKQLNQEMLNKGNEIEPGENKKHAAEQRDARLAQRRQQHRARREQETTEQRDGRLT